MSRSRLIGDLAKSLDSSAVGTFLSKGASDGNFRTILYGDLSGAPTALDSSLSSQLVDSAYVQLRQTSVGGGSGLDSALTIAILDSNYMANRGGYPGLGIYHFDATAGQTVFQESDASGSVLSYTENGIIVFYNGVRLPKADYTATDGTSVTLVDSADSADVISIIKWGLGGGAGGAASWYGDRAVVMSTQSTLDYFDITTLGNASDFGDPSLDRRTTGAVSDATYGVFAGSNPAFGSTQALTIDYVTIATTGNASDFGDLTVGREPRGASDGTYGLYFYGSSVSSNVIDYITIASPGNATDFGDGLQSSAAFGCAFSNGTYGIFGGGYTGGYTNNIEYVTIASPGNGTDFGDLTTTRTGPAGCSDTTYGLFAGGYYDTTYYNVIDYVTMATPGNASDFGDLLTGQRYACGTANTTRGVFAGGGTSTTTNTIEYVTIASPGNATDFGDLVVTSVNPSSTSGSPS